MKSNPCLRNGSATCFHAYLFDVDLYPTIHLLTTLERKPRFEEICDRLSISPGKVREILDFLIGLEMVTEPKDYFLQVRSPRILKKNLRCL